MFAKNQPDQLRTRLATLQRDLKLKRLTQSSFQSQAAEILVALKKMGVQLDAQETQFLESMSSARYEPFEVILTIRVLGLLGY